LPTNLSFYSYYLSDGYLKLVTVFVTLSELCCPWLFFAPVRSLRILAFYWLLFLQICIITTGNYGFLNFTIIAMMLSLLDDAHFRFGNNSQGVNFRKIVSFILTMSCIFFIMIITMTFYKISWEEGKGLDIKIRK